MITKSLVDLIYDAANMQRWNDHVRPHQGFTELDKQAHKMVYAYVLARFEEDDRGADVDWRAVVEGHFCEFLHRLVLTDIKPPIFHRLMAERGAELNRWVLDQLAPQLEGAGGDLPAKLERYFLEPDGSLERSILKASHYLATQWEFRFIHRLNVDLYGIEATRRRIENELEEYYHLAGVQKLSLAKKAHHLMDLLGQLRFQQRWAQSPRLPVTSVMGHTLVVAFLAYLLTLELAPCDRRLVNNFLGGLFHDLPEVMTRDIVSPVKHSVAHLKETIKTIEQRQVEERLLPLIPASWHAELLYYIQDEFVSGIRRDGRKVAVSSAEISARYNEDRYEPIDGELIEACDRLAAFVECSRSLSHGIRSRELDDGYTSLYQAWRDAEVAGIPVGRLFRAFRLED